jgi:hypothetical protein
MASESRIVKLKNDYVLLIFQCSQLSPALSKYPELFQLLFVYTFYHTLHQKPIANPLIILIDFSYTIPIIM